MGTLRQEFQLKNFGFGGVSARLFAIPQARWYFQPISWIIYRFAVAIYTIIWLILILLNWGEPPYYGRPVDTKAKWFLYVSNWSYLFLCAYFLTSSIGTLAYHINTKFKVSSLTSVSNNDEAFGMSPLDDKSARDAENGTYNAGHQIDELRDATGNQESVEQSPGEQSRSNTSMLWYFQITWFLQNVTFAAAFFVTVLFWAIEFDYQSGVISVFNVHVHGVNLVLVLIDMFFIANPYRLLHFIYPSFVALVYFLFTLVYYFAGGTNPYPHDEENGNTFLYQGILDWERATTSSVLLLFIVVLIVTPILHLLFFGLSRLRLAFKCCCACCRTAD